MTIAHRKAIDITRARARAPVPVDEPPEARIDGRPARPRPIRLWAEVAALPEQTAAGRRLPLPGRTALPAGRRHHRRHRRCRPPGGCRRHQVVAPQPLSHRAESWQPDEHPRNRSRRRSSRPLYDPDPLPCPGCAIRWSVRPPRPTSSTSPTAPSTARSARCCWPPPTRAWSGWPSTARTTTWCWSALAEKISPRVLLAPRPAGRRRPAAGRVFRRQPDGLRSAAGLPAVHRIPARGAGASAGDRLRPHRELRAGRGSPPAARGRSARSAPPARPTRCRLSCRAIGWCARTAPSAATAAGRRPRACC